MKRGLLVAIGLAATAGCAAVLGIENITNDPPPDEAGIGDRSVPDTSVPDAGDASIVDTGPPDTFAFDAGPQFRSCVGLVENCGANDVEHCCTTFAVPMGSYLRSNNAAPASVSDFKLDKFEVTVGRLRKFHDAYPGSKPTVGSGARPNIAGSGWDATFDAQLPATQAALRNLLKCGAANTWTDVAGANEARPINCITWFVSQAFCIWDGGWLPTEAEWNYAAAAGSEQRLYAWGAGPLDNNHAIYGNTAIQDVGSKPLGNGKWGQSDLLGNVSEWTLDWDGPYPVPCADCASLTVGTIRERRGSDFKSAAPLVTTHRRAGSDPTTRAVDQGVRCARWK